MLHREQLTAPLNWQGSIVATRRAKSPNGKAGGTYRTEPGNQHRDRHAIHRDDPAVGEARRVSNGYDAKKRR